MSAGRPGRTWWLGGPRRLGSGSRASAGCWRGASPRPAAEERFTSESLGRCAFCDGAGQSTLEGGINALQAARECLSELAGRLLGVAIEERCLAQRVPHRGHGLLVRAGAGGRSRPDARRMAGFRRGHRIRRRRWLPSEGAGRRSAGPRSAANPRRSTSSGRLRRSPGADGRFTASQERVPWICAGDLVLLGEGLGPPIAAVTIGVVLATRVPGVRRGWRTRRQAMTKPE